jgi:chromosome partitioning protein
MTRIIAAANQKGGVGKSTTCAHLCWALVEKNQRVLFIDTDGQGNGTLALTGGGSFSTSAYDLFIGKAVSVIGTKSGVDVIPATRMLHDVDSLPFERYKDFVSAVNAMAANYDYVVIDTPPSLGLRLTAALAVSTDVIVPLACNKFSTMGLVELQHSVNAVRKNINPSVKISAYIANHFRGTKKHKAVFGELNKYMPKQLIQDPLRYSEYIESAVEDGCPIWSLRKFGGQRKAGENMAKVITGIIEKVS